MSTAALPLRLETQGWAPLRTGAALAITVAVFYALCALAWWLAPGTFVGFLNSLFHGLDFSPLVRPAAFRWLGFVEALSMMAAWAFLVGAFFQWLREALDR